MPSSLLDTLDSKPLKNFSMKELELLCQEIRDFLIDSVTKTGGHLASNLGIVELTVALHYIFNLEKDKIIFDVSHQSYVHKILTGRKDKFPTLRQNGGLSGFTSPLESPYDVAQLGHAGTSLSIAMALQKVYGLKEKEFEKIPFSIAVVGDASIANGVAFEALNNISSIKPQKMLIILNDNQMSISKSVGGLSKLLMSIFTHPIYHKTKRLLKTSKVTYRLFRKIKRGLFKERYRDLFESFGINYLGSVDGHNTEKLIKVFSHISHIKESEGRPFLLHVFTKKGKGHKQSEDFPEQYHGVSGVQSSSGKETYSQIFGKTMIDLSKKYQNILCITAAMPVGTGLDAFSKKFPQFFFDVGIAEEHAVAFSSFLNYHSYYKPFIAIYSTFLQRALDQIYQETILQENLNPTFVIDKAGFVGEDGVTHHGLFDIAMIKAFPKAVLLSPKAGKEFMDMLEWSVKAPFPTFIRVSKSYASQEQLLASNNQIIELGKAEWLLKPAKALYTIVSYGPIIEEVLAIREDLPSFRLVNLRFAKPLDVQLIRELVLLNQPIITIEEHAIIGGVGESITHRLIVEERFRGSILNLGVKDTFFKQATRNELLEQAGLKGESLKEQILLFLERNS